MKDGEAPNENKFVVVWKDENGDAHTQFAATVTKDSTKKFFRVIKSFTPKTSIVQRSSKDMLEDLEKRNPILYVPAVKKFGYWSNIGLFYGNEHFIVEAVSTSESKRWCAAKLVPEKFLFVKGDSSFELSDSQDDCPFGSLLDERYDVVGTIGLRKPVNTDRKTMPDDLPIFVQGCGILTLSVIRADQEKYKECDIYVLGKKSEMRWCISKVDKKSYIAHYKDEDKDKFQGSVDGDFKLDPKCIVAIYEVVGKVEYRESERTDSRKKVDDKTFVFVENLGVIGYNDLAAECNESKLKGKKIRVLGEAMEFRRNC